MHDNQIRAPIAGTRQGADEGRVAQRVVQALASSGRFPIGRLQVLTSQGIVKLQGRVTSYYQKQLAQAAALPVIGTRQLVNEIEVD